MSLTAGTKLKSAVCTLEAIVIRPPARDGVLRFGSEAALRSGDVPPGGVERRGSGEPGAALVGKRYVDDVSGLELLCTKGGFAALSFDGRPLSLKQAKPLPSSD